MISPSPSSTEETSSGVAWAMRRQIRSTASVRIWLILIHDRFGKPLFSQRPLFVRIQLRALLGQPRLCQPLQLFGDRNLNGLAPVREAMSGDEMIQFTHQAGVKRDGELRLRHHVLRYDGISYQERAAQQGDGADERRL